MYRAIRGFFDLEDYTQTKSGKAFHEYKAGDVYPRKGTDPSEERIAELSGPNNKLGEPVIRLEEGGDDDEPVDGPAKKPAKARKTAAKKK